MNSHVASPSTRKIRFNNKNVQDFVPEVRRRVQAYFEETGRGQKANAAMVAKTIVLLGGTATVYGLILTGHFTPAQMFWMAVLLGMGMAGIGFSVAHDALHGAYSSNPFVNRMLGYTFDILGANGYMWKITHNVIHHTYTNITGVDEDLTVSPILRLSPDAPRRWYHRFQSWYCFLAYSFATLNWLFVKDFQQFTKRTIGPYTDKKHPPAEWATLVVGKLVALGLVLLPYFVLDIAVWQYVVGVLAAHLTAGMILGVIFQLAHVVEGPEFLMPDEDGRMEHAWIIHEMHTTADFAADNHVLSWYIGGLNYQIEHHLFPQICSVHYPRLSSIVRATAEEYGVPYHYKPTLRAAIASHQRMLRKLGQAA
ncbi:MAG: acyl-CoA desaturase [Bacteroidetes bacterium CG12_big_fil_rev_8_21_14_0_65_60_17]|nr:MAG: acyl-CoA desaturase [Bacteroidetes bacterium CG12_big_fil_rev_8_21_14_0_65_60_17]